MLDFGLAKLKQVAGPASAISSLPTSAGVTAEGTILGTLQYMAPEQLEGAEADARTDIFAFGAVLHEMATGKKTFEGKSQASLIAAILDRDPPPISSFQPMTPPQLDHVAKRCLAKAPDERWQAASDLAYEDIQTKPDFVAGSPRLLFEAPHPVSPTGVSGYDVSPDGQRFLRAQPIEPGQAATQINVVINWFEELKQRVPTAK